MKPFGELIATVIHGPAEAAADSWDELDSIVGGLAGNEHSDLLRLSLKDLKIMGPVDAAIAETLEGLLCDLYASTAAESDRTGIAVFQDTAGAIHIDLSDLNTRAFRDLPYQSSPIEEMFEEMKR